MDDFEQPIDKIIREAREKGAFDDLPGQGKPIRWEDESLTPDDQRLANRLLKNNNFTLDWIALGQELDGEYAAARRELDLMRAARADGRLEAADWQAFARQHVQKMQDLNRRVTGYNLRVPHEQFQRKPFRVDPDVKKAAGI
jgi:hypothetical protein